MDPKLSPPIRSNEFSGNWEQKKFGEIYQVNNERNEGQYPVDKTLSISTMTFNTLGNGAEESSLSKYKVLRIGDIAFEGHTSKKFRYGRFVLNNIENGIMSPRFTTLRPIIKQDYNFWEYYIHSEEVMRDYLVKATKAGTMMNELVPEDLFGQFILVPSFDEQASIGAFLKCLDNLIVFQQDKCEKTVGVKASMLEKLFIQEKELLPQIRFGEYTKPWRKAQLGEIVVPYSDPVETPHDGYERLGIRSHGKGVFHDYVEAGKELGTAQMHRVSAHNLIVNITFAWEHAVAITCENDEGKLVSHRFPQFSMTDDIYDQFLKYLILDSKFRHHLLLSSPGGAGRNRVLKVPEMLEYEMMIPDIEEQKEIAGYLNSLDELIELYKVRVEKLKNIKTAFLQKMFV
ncbi:MAG: restriction endonuclease subunit S [Lachnospiraceae bacterium]|uniref:restriction endonuclease subunit S n=1 Tax=Clostridium sp. WB02_MRS01 TaxID=2605777 RepID=UPI0012B1C6EF|nr:restriction endonuclease subunit S [Clostridium sp. WB02_MRS01]MBW4847913.1 restriction endonuclease subunit S [Lachnospiraceae bacterium]MSS11836.1 hypothetical protein [Clostridium sp. WB02_MRS01]